MNDFMCINNIKQIATTFYFIGSQKKKILFVVYFYLCLYFLGIDLNPEEQKVQLESLKKQLAQKKGTLIY